MNNLNVNPCFLMGHLNSHLSSTSCDDVLDYRYCLPLYKWTSFICNYKCLLKALEIRHLFVFSDFIYINTRVYFLFHLTTIDHCRVLHVGPLKSVCADYQRVEVQIFFFCFWVDLIFFVFHLLSVGHKDTIR